MTEVRRARGSTPARDCLAVLGVFLLLGLLCGVVWWLLADPAAYTKTAQGGSMGDDEVRRQFASDGWYAVVAGVAGVLSGTAVTWWRARDPLLVTVLVVLGAALAAVVMARTGHLLGPGDPAAALEAARKGDEIPMQLDVTARATYLVWPIAVLLGALAVLWSPPPRTGDDSSPSGGPAR
jgi:hypothetical protein